jgi:hypothetical protein
MVCTYSVLSYKKPKIRCQPRCFTTLCRLLLGGALSAVVPIAAHAQSLPPTTPDDLMGLTPYASYHGGDIDNINLSSGNLVVNTPLLAYPQRGNALRLSFDLMYNGKPYQVTQVCVQGKCGYDWLVSGMTVGWEGAMPSPTTGVNVVDADTVSVAGDSIPYSTGKQTNYGTLYKVMTADNAGHLLGLIQGTGGNYGIDCSDDPPIYYSAWGTFEALDGTGWQIQKQCGVNPTVISPTGVHYSGGSTRQDPNGNSITFSSTSVTDTLGRQIPLPPTAQSSSDASTSLCPNGPYAVTSAVYWTPPGYAGTNMQYVFCYAKIPINLPPLGQAPGITYPSAPLLQSIVLPNNTTWIFAYQDTDGTDFKNQPTSFGSLTQITLPNGGTISYTYTTSQNGCDLGSRWVASRTVNANDGTGPHTWTYSYDGATTVVTDPLGNDSVHTFGGGTCMGYEITTQYYAGSHTTGALLKTVTTGFQATTASTGNISTKHPDGSE